MKTRLKKLGFIAITALTVASPFTSCKDDDKTPENGTDEIIDKIPDINGNEQQTVAKQKEYIEEVGQALIKEFSKSNFDEAITAINNAVNTFSVKEDEDDWDWKTVQNWVNDAFKTIETTALGTSKEQEFSEYDYDSWEWDDDNNISFDVHKFIKETYNYDIEDVMALYKVSNFTGKFTAKDKAWTSEKSDHIEFVFKDIDNNDCVLKLVTSGKTVNAWVSSEYDWNDDFEGDEVKKEFNDDKTEVYIEYEYHESGERAKISVTVPEKIVLTFDQNGKNILKTVLNTDLSLAQEPDFDLSKDAYKVSASTEIAGYTFSNDQLSINSKDNKHSEAFSISKGKTKLITCAVNAAVELSNKYPDLTLEDLTYLDGVEVSNPGEASVTYDILGKIQIKGNIKNISDASNAMKEADKNSYNEAAYKAAIKKINDNLDLALYFDGGKTKQAKVVFEPIEESDYGEKYWMYEYMIVFEDGTSTSFGEYFAEKDFKNLINQIERLQQDYMGDIRK